MQTGELEGPLEQGLLLAETWGSELLLTGKPQTSLQLLLWAN